MKRIAFFGPLNPTPSGISDYDEELLPLLRRHYEIDVFTAGESVRDEVFPHGTFIARHRQSPYDLNLYQLGNALIHEIEYGYLFRFPGAVVFHDYVLHHARAKMLMLKAMFREYREESRAAHPEEPRLNTAVYGGMAGNLLLYYYPFVKLVLESSLAAATHTDFIAQKLRITETPVVKIPMAVRMDETLEAGGLHPGRFVIASFGLATQEKRITSALLALAELKWYYPSLLYLIVGGVAPYYPLQSEIKNLGLVDFVEVTGRVNRAEFQRLMRRADVVINLRYPSAGEMSATLLRALALGKPVMMSRLPHLLEIPPEAAIRIRPDREQEDLFHNLWQLVENPALRKSYGDAAISYMQSHHSPEQMVEKYRELIETALQRKNTYRQPQLPLHLRDGREILRDYILRTSLGGKATELLDIILP